METVQHNIGLSLTEALVPVTIPAKQFENMARQVVCTLYKNGTLVSLSGVTANVSGLRPNGKYFQYSSDTDSDVVSVGTSSVSFWVTEEMTPVFGHIPVDVTLTDGDEVLGTFSLVLHVIRAAIDNEGMTAGSYSKLIESLGDDISDVYIDDDGYLVIVTNDALNITFINDSQGNITINY